METSSGHLTYFKTPKTKKVKRANVEFSEATKKAAEMIAGHRCQVGLPDCSGRIDQHHHRKLKSAGGLGGLANDLPICNSCHTRLHREVQWATRHGLIVPSWASPELTSNVFGCGLTCREDHRATRE